MYTLWSAGFRWPPVAAFCFTPTTIYDLLRFSQIQYNRIRFLKHQAYRVSESVISAGEARGNHTRTPYNKKGRRQVRICARGTFNR